MMLFFHREQNRTCLFLATRGVPSFIIKVLISAHLCALNQSVSSLDRMKVRPGIDVCAESDIGCVRENNEDSYVYWEPESDAEFRRKGRLGIVADGMGGYEGGQEASRLAVETVTAYYRDAAAENPQQVLLSAFSAAHERIRSYAINHPQLHGMGTTCTAVVLVDHLLYYAHVGDTRLYLVRGDAITQLTRDHSYVGRLVESGVISREEAETHPQRNILTAALGTTNDPILDSPGRPEPVFAGDMLLLCSDGLWSQLRDAEILKALEGRGANDAAGELIRMARERGGPDNITVQILRLT